MKEIENTDENVELEIPLFLIDTIDKKQLYIFLKRLGYLKSGGKTKMIYDLINNINKTINSDEQKKKISEFEEFCINQIKYTTNRIVITVPIEVKRNSILKNKTSLLSYMNITEIESNFNKVLDWNSANTEFVMLHQHFVSDKNEMKKIERAYGRRVKYKVIHNQIEKTEIKHEFIWMEIDIKENCVRINISDNPKNLYDDTKASISEMQKMFFNIARKDFNITQPNNLESETTTLFKMYRALTRKMELPYTNVVVKCSKDIKEFSEKIKKELVISDQDDIGLENRVFKLFERALIQRDFNKFLKNDKDIVGKVKTLVFRDRIGGSVQANAGGKTGPTQEDEIDLEKCDVYFDTKESIYSSESLYSVLIEWKNDSILLENDSYRRIKVKYTAFPTYYTTHFIRYNVWEEVYNYVLPKFREYKDEKL